MATHSPGRPMPDTYFKLVRTFPLTRIQDDQHLDEALQVIDQLLRSQRDDGSQQYLEVLTDLVEAYEEEHIEIPDASEAEVLRALMQAHQLSQAKLAKQAGIAQSTILAVLNGDRSLTKAQVSQAGHSLHRGPGETGGPAARDERALT